MATEIQPWQVGDLVEFRVFDKSRAPTNGSSYMGKLTYERRAVEEAFKDDDGIWCAVVQLDADTRLKLPAGQVWRVLNAIDALAALA